MGDATADGTMYSVIYMNNEIPQLLVRKYYHKEYIVSNKIFGYDIEKHACIDSDVIFQTENPPQIRPKNYPESFGIYSKQPYYEGNRKKATAYLGE